MRGMSAIGQAAGRFCPKFLAINNRKYKNSLFYRGYDDECFGSDMPQIIEYIKKIFPNNVTTGSDREDIETLIPITKEFIANRTQTIFNPVLKYKDYCWYADFMDLEEKGYRIYIIVEDIKLHASIFKEQNYIDFIFRNSGIGIAGISFIYINSKYVKNGEIEPRKLFKIEEICSLLPDHAIYDTLTDEAQEEDILSKFCYTAGCFFTHKEHGRIVQDVCPYFWRDCKIDNYKYIGKYKYDVPIRENLYIKQFVSVNPYSVLSSIEECNNHMAHFLFARKENNYNVYDYRNAIREAYEHMFYVDKDRLRLFLAGRNIDCFYQLSTHFMGGGLPIFDGESPCAKYAENFDIYSPNRGLTAYEARCGNYNKELFYEVCTSFLEVTKDYSTFATYDRHEQTKFLHDMANLFPNYSERLRYIIYNTIFLSDVIEGFMFYHKGFEMRYDWGMIGYIFRRGEEYMGHDTFFCDLLNNIDSNWHESVQFYVLHQYLQKLSGAE